MKQYLLSLGMSETSVFNVMKPLKSLSKEQFQERLAFYQKALKIDVQRVLKLVRRNPYFMLLETEGDGENTAEKRFEFLKRTLRTNSSGLISFFEKSPKMLELNVSEAGKAKFLSDIENIKDIFGTDLLNASSFALNHPKLFEYDLAAEGNESLRGRVAFYRKMLGVRGQWVLKNEKLFDLEIHSNKSGSLKTKIHRMREYFKFSDNDICTIISANPIVLNYDFESEGPDSIYQKVQFYKSKLGLSGKEVGEMLIKFKSLMSYSIDGTNGNGVINKIDKLGELVGYDEALTIVKANPCVLSIPVNQLKARYMLGVISGNADKIYTRGILINERNLWARYSYLRERKFSYAGMYIEEKVFAEKYGRFTDALTEKFPFDENSMKFLERRYALGTGKVLKFDESERARYKSEGEDEKGTL